jgi:hypothetical protein
VQGLSCSTVAYLNQLVLVDVFHRLLLMCFMANSVSHVCMFAVYLHAQTEAYSLSPPLSATAAAEQQPAAAQQQQQHIAPDCIVCRERTSQPLGYVAYAQRSNVLDVRIDGKPLPEVPIVLIGAAGDVSMADLADAATHEDVETAQGTQQQQQQQQPAEPPAVAAAAAALSGSSSIRKLDGPAHLHISFCGHALHAGCYAQYYKGVAAAHAADDMTARVTLDVAAGDFNCPLCKSLSNVLVPYAPKLCANEALQSTGTQHHIYNFSTTLYSYLQIYIL